MKSRERGGAPPEAREEKGNQKDSAEKSASPERHSEAEWEELKRTGAARALTMGKEMGVPREELDRFTQEVIARETASQDYAFVYRFRKNTGFGTEDEVRAAGLAAYSHFFETGEFGLAKAMAEEVYGQASAEWQRADEAMKTELKKESGRKREEREFHATISKNTTFADLFNIIDAVEEKDGLGALHFEEELVDNFDTDLVEEVLAFRDVQASTAATTKVFDFFKERGYSLSDISTLLPIRLKRERKKK